MEYIDPQKARQERERQERERQARLKVEQDRKAKIEAEKKRQAKLKAERDRKARIKAEEERQAKLKAEQQDPDKKPTQAKKPDEKQETKKPKGAKKPDEKSQTEITWSKPGETSPIYGSSAPIYSSISPIYIYGQPSDPIAKGREPKPKSEVPNDRMPRTWTGEQADPQPEPKSKSVEEPALEALRARVLLEDADKLEERRKRYQNSVKQEPEVSEIFKQPSLSNGSLALGVALTNPLIGASFLSGAQALGQPEKTHPQVIKLASAHAQSNGAKAESPEQQLHHQFETNVAAKAQGLLKANKDRLNSEQTQYIKDNNPKSDRWSNLWQVASQQREFQTQQANLQKQLEFTTQEMSNLSDIPDGIGLTSTPQQRQNSLKHKKLLALSDQMRRLKERIDQAKQMQVSLEYAYPALSAVKGETGASPEDIKRVQGRLPQEFNGIRKDIDRISQWLTDDPSKAWLFDSVVAAQLKDKSLSPSQRQQLAQQSEKAHPAGGIMLGAALSGGLFAASFVPMLQDISIPLLLSGIGVGGAVAAAEVPDLMLLDGAAQAGRGGAGKLTSQSPEQARFNLVMGYANVALAGLDVAAEGRVIYGLKGLVGRLSGQGAQVLRETWVQVMRLAAQGEVGLEKARMLLAKAKGMSGAMVDEVLEVLSPSQEVAGVGRMSRNEMRGQTAGQVTTQQAVQTAKAKAKKPKDMTPIERLAYSQDKYGQVKNWDEVEPLIGTAVTQQTKLPAGYRLFQKPGRSKQLFILRENVEDASVVPLMIENGKIQAGKTRLSRGLDVMKKSLKAVGIDTPKGYQLNHLVPDAVAQSDPMVVEMLKRNIYDVDHAGNLLPMPGEVRGAHPDLIGHLGSHDNYNRLVSRELKLRKDDLIEEYGSLSKVPDKQLENAVKKVENMMRENIIKRSPEIPTRYDPKTGTKVLSEGISDPDFVA